MKTLKKLILLALLCFSSVYVSAQALVLKDFGSLLQTEDGIYCAVDNMKTVTPSGNILYKHVFQIPVKDSLVPEKGVNKVECNTIICNNGAPLELIDLEALFFSDGRVVVIFHSNGSGDLTPSVKSNK